MGVPNDIRLSFNRSPGLYDAVRPGYPPAVFDRLFALLPSHPEVIEVGPGTGQATGDLLSRGARVTAVEIGPALASTLRAKHSSDLLAVISGDFEVVELPDAGFDAVFSASAYHWISKDAQLDRPAQLLRRGGVFATADLVQVDSPVDQGFFAAVQPIFNRYGQHHVGPPAPAREHVERPIFKALSSDTRYTDVNLQIFDWDQTYSAEQYRQLLLTDSGRQMMAESERRALVRDIEDFINEEFNGQITRPLVVALTTSRLR